MRDLKKVCSVLKDVKSTQRRVGNGRENGLQMPSLEEARRCFCELLDDPHWFTTQQIYESKEEEEKREATEALEGWRMLRLMQSGLG